MIKRLAWLGYRACLFLLPTDFRREYRADMEEDFSEALDTVGAGGLLAPLLALARASLDIAIHTVRLRFGSSFGLPDPRRGILEPRTSLTMESLA